LRPVTGRIDYCRPRGTVDDVQGEQEQVIYEWVTRAAGTHTARFDGRSNDLMLALHWRMAYAASWWTEDAVSLEQLLRDRELAKKQVLAVDGKDD